MKHVKPYHFLGMVLFLFFSTGVLAQDEGRLSGNLEANGNFFFKDSLIGAVGTPQYERQLYSADAWLNLNYSNWGFDFGLRFDLFNNSNLLDPQNSFTGEGIGRWYIKKQIQKLHISGGYLYDQIGSGIIFRAFEQRPLLIDNALFGVRLGYDLTPDWRVKLFTGRQKRQFEIYNPVIKGANMEGFFTLGDSTVFSFSPGFGVVSRTLDDETMNQVVNTLSTYSRTDSIGAKYNAYAFSLYNTLTVGPISWYVEGAYKTEEVIFDPFAEKLNLNGEISRGKFILEPGSVIYSSLSFAGSGFGVTLEGKRTENFTFRATPFEVLNRGMINFLPPMTRLNTYRLTARYNAATQELGEIAYQADIRYSPSRKWSFNVNYSDIQDLNQERLYREVFTEVIYKKPREYQLQIGVQHQTYNQERYEEKPDAPLVQTITPYFDFLYKISRKKAIRFEGQFMRVGSNDIKGESVRQDYGNWIFGLVEYSIAPHWTFTASDMFNVGPGKNSPVDSDTGDKKKIHYPRFDVFYTHGQNRFSLSYVKQVEGVVCTGGICRLEPAFHGVKMTVNSTF